MFQTQFACGIHVIREIVKFVVCWWTRSDQPADYYAQYFYSATIFLNVEWLMDNNWEWLIPARRPHWTIRNCKSPISSVGSFDWWLWCCWLCQVIEWIFPNIFVCEWCNLCFPAGTNSRIFSHIFLFLSLYLNPDMDTKTTIQTLKTIYPNYRTTVWATMMIWAKANR